MLSRTAPHVRTAASPFFLTRIATCYPDRAALFCTAVPELPHVSTIWARVAPTACLRSMLRTLAACPRTSRAAHRRHRILTSSHDCQARTAVSSACIRALATRWDTSLGSPTRTRRRSQRYQAHSRTTAFVPRAQKRPVLLLFCTRITICYPDRAATGPHFVPGLPHVVVPLAQSRTCRTTTLWRSVAALPTPTRGR